MANSISVNGTFVEVSGTSLTAVSVTPGALGDAFLFSTSYVSTATLSTVSGGGCTTWTKLVGAFTAYSGSAKVDLWMGVITSSVGTPVNITIAGTGLTNTQRLSALEFTSGGGPETVWAQDGSSGTKTNTTSTTVTFPTLTPGGINRMYIAYGLVANSASPGTQTAGYTLDLDFGSNPYLFNPNVSTSQTPTCTQVNGSGVATSGLSGNIAALVTATNPPTPRPLQILTQGAVSRASSF